MTRIRPDFLIEEAETLEQARAKLQADPDVELVLLDLKLPDCDGLVGLLALRAEFPQAPVIIVSATEDPAIVSNAIAMGAQGFIPKSTPLPAIAEALGVILEGDVWTPASMVLGAPTKEAKALASLSPAQARILSGLRRGLLNKQIAYELGLTEATVKAHMTATLKKLGVSSRTQVLILAQSVGYGDNDPAAHGS